MRSLIVWTILTSVGSTATASQEQIHHWAKVSLTAPTNLFGDVEVRATANTKGEVKTLEVVVKGKAITVSSTFLASLPPLRLSSVEVRSEHSARLNEKFLYIVFSSGRVEGRAVQGAIDVHLTIRGGVMVEGAAITTYDGKGSSKWEQRKP